MRSIGFREIIAGVLFLTLSECSLVSKSIPEEDKISNGVGRNSDVAITWYEDETELRESEILRDGLFDRFTNIIPGWNMKPKDPIVVTEPTVTEGLFDRFSKIIPGWNMKMENAVVPTTEAPNKGLFNRFSNIIPGRDYLSWNTNTKNDVVTDVTTTQVPNEGLFNRFSNIIPGRHHLSWNTSVPDVTQTVPNDGRLLNRVSNVIPGRDYFPWNGGMKNNVIIPQMIETATAAPKDGLLDRFSNIIPGRDFLSWNMRNKNVPELNETEVANDGFLDGLYKNIPGREFLMWNMNSKNSTTPDVNENEVPREGLLEGLSKIIPGRDFLTWNVKTKNSNLEKNKRRKKIRYLLTDKHIDQYHPLKRDGSDASTRLLPGCTLKVLIHGFTHRDESWEEKITRSKMFMLADEFIESGRADLEVIVVDWTELSSYAPYRYREAADSTQYVGVDVAEFLVALEARKLISFDKLHIIGYSLGSHVSGVAGYTIQELTGRKVGRITGIEPAGPLFVEGNDLISDKRMALEKTDAQFVDIIHCNMGDMLDAKWGSKVQAGHADFYPNGGKTQRGCDSFRDATQGCSHSVCPAYYVQSILQRRFPSCRCPSWKTYNRAKYKCDCQEYAVEMGEHLNTSIAHGRYYLHI